MFEGSLPDENPTYLLAGEALEIAKEFHNFSQSVSEEYKGIEQQMQEYSDELHRQIHEHNEALLVAFDEKHHLAFEDLFDRLAKAVGITRNEIKNFRLDATYLNQHDIAFMKQGPIDDNVLICNTDPEDEELDIEIEEEGC